MLSGIAQFFKGDGWSNYRKTLRYALYVILHPFDGFWDLTHEKRGSMAAAHTIVILTVLTHLWDRRFTSFMLNNTQWSKFSIVMNTLGILVPLVIWVVANWCVTTLFDGKGRMREIYMGTAYALTPYPLIGLPMIVISNMVTKEEGVFYTYFNVFALIWAGFLILCAVLMIHDYSLLGGILAVIFSIVGMAVIMFIVLLFFSLISDAVMYVVSIYKEIVFRL
ncbi:MAG: YIP1 family protein [Lachnospiraceae bacterium]|nr:YIP1 family protein [Lachnospiraceae bacterium]